MNKLPTYGSAYAKILLSRKKGGVVGQIEESIKGVRLDRSNLRSFMKIAGAVDDGRMPPTYPHVMIGALHARVISRSDFPHPALGLVHVSNRIRVIEPMGLDDSWDVTVRIDGQRDANKGIEFDLITEFSKDGKVVWDQVTTILRPSGERSPGKRSKPAPIPRESGAHTRSSTFTAREDIGRKYAAVSGDYNPIHLHAAAAKLFGFKRAIATGMWTVARIAAELDTDMPDAGYVLDVAFKRPIFLPSRVVFEANTQAKETRWRVLSTNGKTLHMTGSVLSLNAENS